ncbi:hypothetical protein [Leptospira sp. 'Mane']|uniref:hypothetical protein n=1 Tax=Leptospira sp. 'Mane' TaxID=3387407 RepID=UPI00398B828A
MLKKLIFISGNSVSIKNKSFFYFKFSFNPICAYINFRMNDLLISKMIVKRTLSGSIWSGKHAKTRSHLIFFGFTVAAFLLAEGGFCSEVTIISLLSL